MARRGDRYSLDSDGLLVEEVGLWANDKLKIVTDYVQASGGARKKYSVPGAAYIDIFCGPGRSRVRETGKFIDGSPIAAFKKGQGSPGPFTSVYVSDADDELLSSCEKRLQNLDAPVRAVKGPASEAMPAIVQQLNPAGFTLRIP